MVRRLMSLVLIPCILLTITPVFAQQAEADLLSGKTQGETDGGSGVSLGWSAVGCLFGPFGVAAGCLMPGNSPPSSTQMLMMGKSEMYKNGYLTGYRSASQKKAWKSALIGWILWIPIGVTIALSAE